MADQKSELELEDEFEGENERESKDFYRRNTRSV
jgi:hypothetical protein